jgi:hypothetical protein
MSRHVMESTELIQAETGWNRVFFGYAPYIALGLVLSAAIPDRGFTSLPTANALVETVAGVVPSIDRLAALSPLPEMTRAFGALMWLAYPFFTVWAWVRAPRVPRRMMPWVTLLLTLPLSAVALVLLGLLAPFFFIADAPAPSYLGGRGSAGLAFLISSRIGHGTLGSVVFAFSSISLVFLLSLTRDYPRLLAYNLRSRLTGNQ